MAKGLIAYVFRANGIDCTNGGESSRFNEITIIELGSDSEIFDATADRPAFRLQKGYGNTVRLVPASLADRHVMFGGNFAHTSDSRFSRAITRITEDSGYYAVPIHDRVE